MNAPLAPVQLKLVLDDALREEIACLDDEAFGRFEFAWECAERLLGRGAYALSGALDYLVPCAGIVLAIRFDARRERFVVVAFENLGDDPDPDGGHRSLPNFTENALAAMGLDVAIADLRPPVPGARPSGAPSSADLLLPLSSIPATLAISFRQGKLVDGYRQLVMAHGLMLLQKLRGVGVSTVDGAAPSADP